MHNNPGDHFLSASSLVLPHTGASVSPAGSSEDLVDVLVPPPQRGGRRSLQSAQSDAIPLPPPLSTGHKVSSWGGSADTGPLVLSSHKNAPAADNYRSNPASKQLELYRNKRIQDFSREDYGHGTTNATSWMMCPQTFGGVGLNLTMEKTAPKYTTSNNLRKSSRTSRSAPLLAAPSEWVGEQSRYFDLKVCLLHYNHDLYMG